MSKFIDITGKRFNRLVVIERANNAKGGIPVWKCLCDCGKTTFVRGSNLKNGAVKSCGCLRNDTKPALTHNMSNSRLYRIWAGIKSRCYTKSSRAYQNYGNRGIKVCDEWKDSFDSFMEWAISHGYTEKLTIERIDVNGDYCPDNCTWIPFNEQQGNRRNCYAFEYNGRVQNLADWCKELNLPYGLIHNRINKLGWDFERAINEPVDIKKRNHKNG